MAQCVRLNVRPQRMPDAPSPGAKFTDLPELSAYVLAHAAGLTWGVFVNPVIFRSLVAHGYSDHILLAAIAHSIAVSLVVLLIFLVLRNAMSGSGAPPPPADRPAAAAAFTDAREIGAYLLAHAAGIAWGAIFSPLVCAHRHCAGLSQSHAAGHCDQRRCSRGRAADLSDPAQGYGQALNVRAC